MMFAICHPSISTEAQVGLALRILCRTYALSKANGKEEAIIEAEKLSLTDNHFYFALLGELYTSIDDDKARLHFQKAFSLAKTQADRQAIQKKIDRLMEF